MGVFSSRFHVRVPLCLLLASTTSILPTAPIAAQPLVGQQSPVSIHWSQEALAQLIDVVASAGQEGLHPADYRLAALRQSASAEEGPALDALASAAALDLAHDYLLGRVEDRSGMNWMIARSPNETAGLADRLRQAVATGKIREFYAGLLPSDPRYQALRSALATSEDRVTRDRLRANMERWRWMPRAIGSDYLYVNVPSYRLQMFREGIALASYDVVVGAKDTPTPQLLSPTDSLVVNPAWYVPTSIARKSGLRPGRGGYVWKATPDGGRRIVQLPGPHNALGRIKFNLDNDQAIYLHDTNAKALFGRDQRALSHGCIRVKDIDQLAADLLSQAGGDQSRFEEALASSETTTVRLPHAWPVYIVYFTTDTDESGNVVTYSDPYGYDAELLAALDGKPIEMASS